MLRLLFCTAAILPIGFIPFITSGGDEVEATAQATSYSEMVTDPTIESLQDCEVSDLPIFFNEGLVTAHSADYINDGLEAVEGCGDVEVTIVPMLPEDAQASDYANSVDRTAELSDYVEAAANVSEVNVDIDISEQVVEEDVSTLYINGRAAILHIEPEDDAG